jgi:signal transduction histidine kinase/CheY-like chemotaxis protein
MTRNTLDPRGEVLVLRVASEQDVVTARQRARQIAEYAGLDRQDQVRVATAVSEIARNALQYAGGGRVEFAIENGAQSSVLLIAVSDDGAGIADVRRILDGEYHSTTGMGVGIAGARRLMNGFQVESAAGGGTIVTMRKYLPERAVQTAALAGEIAQRLGLATPDGNLDELQLQNHQLIAALEELERREQEVHRLSQELEDTNRGVLALYAELDDVTVSLRRADELKTRFLSHVSHEFRTPLNSILALTRLLLSHVDGHLTPQQEKQIGYVRRAAEDLTDMVNDLLDLAKVEAGKTVIHAAHAPLNNLLGTLRGLMRPIQVNEGVELIIEEGPSDIILNTDEAKVSQILRNLVSNALKFTERGEVRVWFELMPDDCAFVVSDTGIGIPLEYQEAIFQEFTQIENPLQKSAKGTGLGLPLSRKLAELLGGALTLVSEPARGSTFRFSLPCDAIVQTHATQIQAAANEPYSGNPRGRSLLVIDDDEVARYLVRQFLRGMDVSVIEADSGSTGLDRARFDRPDAILLDLSMPGMNGFDVMERLKDDAETAKIPILVYTSRTLSASDHKRLANSAAALLPKRDLTREKFMMEISRALGTVALSEEGEEE